MNMFASFCRAIDDGLFDEVEGAEKNGAQRLIAASDPFVGEASLTEEQQRELLERLDDRKLQRQQPPAP